MKWHKPESNTSGMQRILESALIDQLHWYPRIDILTIHSYRENGDVVEINYEIRRVDGTVELGRRAIDGWD